MDIHKKNYSPKVAVIMPVRNEEKILGKTLQSLLAQELVPYRIIVINDGSTDNTLGVLAEYSQVEVVNLKTEKSQYGKKGIAKTLNAGLAKLYDDTNCEFILKLDADHILPKNYLSEITSRMQKDPKIAASAGVIEGMYTIVPIHSGRVVRYDFWKKLYLKYPINFAYEDYFLLKAESMGYVVCSFSDIVSHTLRKTRERYSDPKSYVNFGKGMKALGYTLSYILSKSFLLAMKNPLGAYYMLKGYFDKEVELYEPELREFVKNKQHQMIFHSKSSNLKRAYRILKEDSSKVN